jgi:hypothetical protein
LLTFNHTSPPKHPITYRLRQQADPDYFKKREEANESGKTAAEEKRAAKAATGSELAEGGGEEEEEEGDPFAEAEADPFRSYVDKKRSKLHIR